MNNPKYHFDIEQGSPEWLSQRSGIMTASNVKLLFTPKLAIAKGQKIEALAMDMAAQRVTDFVEEFYPTLDMQRGSFDEKYAREAYEKSVSIVQEVGFVTAEFVNDKFHEVTLGYSPDGLVPDGLIEIKSRKAKLQFQTIITGKVPDEYVLQMQTGMLVTGRDYCDFVSYCAGMPLFVQRVLPDIELQKRIIEAVGEFENQVVAFQAQYNTQSAGLEPTERIVFKPNFKENK